MADSPLPKRLQELAAGYVLGNLDPEELQEFVRLSAEHPEQSIFITELQDLMNQLPFALKEEKPPQALGDRILASVSPPRRNFKWQSLIFGVALVSAIGLGLDSLLVRQQLRITQQQLIQKNTQLAQLNYQPQTPQRATLQINTSPQVLMANWDGITLVLDDHLRAQKKGKQAVEIQANQQSDLIKKFQDNNLILPSPVPSLSMQNTKLLGGAICTFGQTKGVRIMYKTPQKDAISFYQLHLATTPNFPSAVSDPIVIQSKTGPNLLIWGNDTFLFAIVADLPQTTLEDLSKDLIPHSNV